MKQNFDVMSNKLCSCGKHIKQNVIDRQPNADKCYSCSRKAKGLLPRKMSHKRPKGPYQISSKGISQ